MTRNPPNQPPAPRPTSPRLPPWAFATLCILASAIVTVIWFELMFPAILPPSMVGKWVVTDGGQEGSTLEFFRDGTMKGQIKQKGKEASIQWKVTMNGEKFRVAVGDSYNGFMVTEDHTILDLTDRRFVFMDRSGETTILARYLPGKY